MTHTVNIYDSYGTECELNDLLIIHNGRIETPNQPLRDIFNKDYTQLIDFTTNFLET